MQLTSFLKLQILFLFVAFIKKKIYFVQSSYTIATEI